MNGMVWIGVSAFTMMAVAAVSGMISDYKKRQLELEPLRTAIERGQQLDPAVVDRLMGREQGSQELNPLHLRVGGIISIDSGIGLAALAWFISQAVARAFFPTLGIGILAVCVGAGLCVAARAVEQHKSADVSRVALENCTVQCCARPGRGSGAGRARDGRRREAAFSELVRRRQSGLRNLLRRLCRDRALADDLAQHALLQAWRSLRNLKSVTAFGGWLRQVAVNVWLNHLRTAPPRTQSIESDAAVDAEQAVTPAASEALDLDRALGQLASDERLCVVLAYHEGMSHSEISGATGLPLGTVKSHIKRGAERLRSLLHAYQPDGGQLHVR